MKFRLRLYLISGLYVCHYFRCIENLTILSLHLFDLFLASRFMSKYFALFAIEIHITFINMWVCVICLFVNEMCMKLPSLIYTLHLLIQFVNMFNVCWISFVASFWDVVKIAVPSAKVAIVAFFWLGIILYNIGSITLPCVIKCLTNIKKYCYTNLFVFKLHCDIEYSIHMLNCV